MAWEVGGSLSSAEELRDEIRNRPAGAFHEQPKATLWVVVPNHAPGAIGRHAGSPGMGVMQWDDDPRTLFTPITRRFMRTRPWIPHGLRMYDAQFGAWRGDMTWEHEMCGWARCALPNLQVQHCVSQPWGRIRRGYWRRGPAACSAGGSRRGPDGASRGARPPGCGPRGFPRRRNGA